jgi:geranylgeranyl pyrophosphate synthase
MNIDILLDPVKYTINSGGKNTRGLVIKYVQNLIGNGKNTLTGIIMDDINNLHNISLVIDDIQDGTKKRRGQDCAHIIYGMPLSLNAAYLKCFNLLKNVEDRYPKEIKETTTQLFISALESGHIGQGLDIYWTTKEYIPTLDEYLYMIDNKTGMLFELGSKLCFETAKLNGIEVTKEKRDLIQKLMIFIGRFFQIRDDYVNLTSPKYWRLKGFCEDFDEKKVSYIFTLLNMKDENDILYRTLCSTSKVSEKEKIDYYGYLYNKQILHQTYVNLEVYKGNIISVENALTGSKEITGFLKMFFEKLEYSPPIDPIKIKQTLLATKMS